MKNRIPKEHDVQKNKVSHVMAGLVLGPVVTASQRRWKDWASKATAQIVGKGKTQERNEQRKKLRKRGKNDSNQSGLLFLPENGKKKEEKSVLEQDMLIATHELPFVSIWEDKFDRMSYVEDQPQCQVGSGTNWLYEVEIVWLYCSALTKAATERTSDQRGIERGHRAKHM